MTCLISCKITPSNKSSASKRETSSMSKRMSPRTLIVGHALQICEGPAEPRVPPTPSIPSSEELIRRRPAGKSALPPQGTWVITSDHLVEQCREWFFDRGETAPYCRMPKMLDGINVRSSYTKYLPGTVDQPSYDGLDAARTDDLGLRCFTLVPLGQPMQVIVAGDTRHGVVKRPPNNMRFGQWTNEDTPMRYNP